ncbi:hypothetical protein TREPR_3582 [Treponema primitia ZAS-2]|uniref:Uncharacterized protein n=1 Tax=Treponema primitia (strain ATCC BAA-887 / DSM 12427 / ZAS-2) TaxID=545694 RepID=F5YR35_TREPZ|nr:DUF6672 family protein [Treponema primitia]AEF86299.1 hypothetical protein TREPR_3582 [Treponema primitia ZAS-2]
MENNIKRRRLIIRSALVIAWIGLGVLLFILNRGHSILVDNRNIEADNIRAPDLIKVSVDGSKTLEFFRGDRDIFDVGGGLHRIRVEFSDGKPPFETNFTLPLKPDMFLLSIPRMINGMEPYFEEFHSTPEPRKPEEEELPGEEEIILP